MVRTERVAGVGVGVVDRDEVVIRCAGLVKVFKDFWMRDKVKAVNGIDLEIRRGEIFGLLGPNGSGKSTTIKMLLGLLRPSGGKISIYGHVPSDVGVKGRIGYLPEESFLYRFLNARETLDYYGRLFNLSASERASRIDMLLEMVGLSHMQRRPVGEYSKGMQRRIGLAQALINDPDLLILDEPTTGLDPIGTRQIKDVILSLRDRGKTVLLCSHLLSDVEDVVDRVAIMYGGHVCEYGEIDELLRGADGVSRISLEQKFLEMVERERSKGTATSGAGSGGRLAGFLGDGELTPLESAKRDASQVIANLVDVGRADVVEDEAEAEVQEVESDGVDQSLLAGLVDGAAGDHGDEDGAVEVEDIVVEDAGGVIDSDVLDGLMVEDGEGEVGADGEAETEEAEISEFTIGGVEEVEEVDVVASDGGVAEVEIEVDVAGEGVESAEIDEVVDVVEEPGVKGGDDGVAEEGGVFSMFEQAMEEVPEYEGDESFSAEDLKDHSEVLKPSLRGDLDGDEEEAPDQSFIDALTDRDDDVDKEKEAGELDG